MRMNQITINELLQDNFEHYQPYKGLFEPITPLPDNYTFFNAYIANSQKLDLALIAPKYSERVYVSTSFSEDETDLNIFKSHFGAWLSVNADNYQKIYDSILEEYNPLDNYDKTSTITTERTGQETHTNQTQTNNSMVEATKNTQSAEQTENMSHGNNTTVNHTGTTVNKRKPFNGSESTEYSRGEIPNDDTTTAQTETNNNTIGNKSTNNTDSTVTNTGAQNGSDILSFTDRKDIVTERTRGNIGVTTSSAMLSEFLNTRWGINFYEDLFKKFLFDYTY